jgi:hypothetical protein
MMLVVVLLLPVGRLRSFVGLQHQVVYDLLFKAVGR